MFTPEAKAALYRPALREQLAGIDSLQAAARPWFDEAAHFDRINQALYLDMQLLLSGNNLVKPDRMGMAVSIEVRTPFLDWRMIEFAFRARGHTKLSDREKKKHWFKRAAAPLIGDDLAYRSKQIFTVPSGEWLRQDSYPWLARVLAHEGLQRMFDARGIQAMLHAQRNSKDNNTRELRALAVLGLWLQDHV